MKHAFWVILLLSFCFYQCSENDCCASPDDTYIDIVIQDESRTNLVANNTINKDMVKTYHIINGEEVEFFEGNADAQRGVLFAKDEEEPFIRLYPNTNMDSDGSAATIIDWGVNAYTRDTIISEFDTANDFIFCEKVRLNGTLVWDATVHQERRMIEIIK